MKPRAGFTLIEVLAVVFLTGIVLTVALSSYVNLSHASSYAAERTRSIRRATAILDRVGRDFEGAMLVRKPAELDPLAHPWVFLAESHGVDGGSDHVKFPVRNHTTRGGTEHESNLAMIAYTVERSNDDTLDLFRWTSLHLPESLDRSFPFDRDETALLAEGLAHFAVRFQNEDGEWRGSWDSSTIRDSTELPQAVEIQVAMADPTSEDGGIVYRRLVRIRVRPLDLQALLDPEGGSASGDDSEDEGDDEDEDDDFDDDEGATANTDPEGAATVADCIAIELLDASDPEIAGLIATYNALAGQPFAAYRAQVPVQFIRPECL